MGWSIPSNISNTIRATSRFEHSKPLYGDLKQTKAEPGTAGNSQVGSKLDNSGWNWMNMDKMDESGYMVI